MSIYSENIAALDRNYPDLSERVKHLKDDYSVKIRNTGQEGMCTCILGDGDSDGRTLNSTENPLEEARRYVRMVVGDEDKAGLVVMSGLGMGYYLQALFDGKLYPGSVVLVFEPDIQLFKKFIENRHLQLTVDGKNINIFDAGCVRFLVGLPVDKVYSVVYDILQDVGKNYFSSTEFIEHPKLIRVAKQYYKPVFSELSRVFYDIRSSFGNDPEDSWFGVDHQFQNLDIILNNPGVSGLKNKFKDVPAVIAATGPSLDKNIDLLHSIKDKAVFFAADASLNSFLNYSTPIVPDIVCSLERNLTTREHFAQIPDDKKVLMRDIWLAACPVVKPEVYEEWHGKHMIVFRDFAHFKWLGLDKGILNTGKSVTNLAFMVAYYMGCSPIVLVGQDLAFAPDGKTHVNGATHASDGMRKSQLMNQQCEVMGNDGKAIKSLDTWVGMRRRFEKDIEELKVKCVNATEGGALIKGTKIMRFKDAIEQFMTKDIDVQSILSDNLTRLSDEDVQRDFDIVNKNVKDGVDYYKVTLDNIDIAKDCIEEYFSGVVKDGINDTYLEKILEYCENLKMEILNHPMCYHSAMHVIQSVTLGCTNTNKAIDRRYDGAEKSMAKLIVVFKLFCSLEILFKKMNSGVRGNYGKFIREFRPDMQGVWD